MCLCLPLFANSQSARLVESLKSKLQAEISKAKIPTKDLGLIATIHSDASVQEIFELNSDKQFTPASITKLITAAAVLNQIPPGTRFKTFLYFRGKPEGETLKGSVVLAGSGDPSFVSENMWFLVNAFTRTGVRNIQGDIIIDSTIFDSVKFDESREKDRVDRAYDAPTSGASFNWNSVNIFVRPSKSGQPASVFLDPENQFTHLVNKVKTVAAGKKTEVFSDRLDSNDGKNTIKVYGQIAENDKEVTIFKNITQPDLWIGNQLVSFLKQRGVTVSGKVIVGKSNASDVVAAVSESKPIEHMLSDMNKFSNNYVAEMLTKQLGSLSSTPGTIENGVQKMRIYLKDIGIPEKEYVLLSPSGLNRDNQFTAKHFLTVLTAVQKQLKLYPEFLSSLPIAGVDGTLKNRMKGTPAERWVRAKTGYLNSVISLAGFAGRKDGTVVPFVFIFNGSADEAKVRSLFDRLSTILVE